MAFSHIRNHILGGLPPEIQASMAPHLTRTPLAYRQQLFEPGEAITQVYFLEAGIASTVTVAGSQSIEIGILGWDAMAGHSIVLGVDLSPYHVFMQVAGFGLQMDPKHLRRLMRKYTVLDDAMRLAAHAFMMQVGETALANGQSKLQVRLARWLLMCQDRTDGYDLALTHEFLAVMLGVRRAGVTLALQTLEGDKLIRSSRSKVMVADRKGLIAIAGAVYTPLPQRRFQ